VSRWLRVPGGRLFDIELRLGDMTTSVLESGARSSSVSSLEALAGAEPTVGREVEVMPPRLPCAAGAREGGGVGV
jgi:hypothetical protein